MRDDFAIFIITHGRAHNQRTAATLDNLGYNGKLYFVVDNQDETIQDYIDVLGSDRIIVFDKDYFIHNTDVGLSVPAVKFAVFARNAVEYIAKSLGYTAFMVLDDDITKFRVRLPVDGHLKSYSLANNFNAVLELCVEYMINNDLACISPGFVNVYREGVGAFEKSDSRYRICAEAFIRNTKFFVNWRPNMVEDSITSIDSALCGQVWIQFLPVQVEIHMSEGVVDGGNSDVYRQFGKFRLNFMAVMLHPSANIMRFCNGGWKVTTRPDNCVPKILSSRYKV